MLSPVIQAPSRRIVPWLPQIVVPSRARRPAPLLLHPGPCGAPSVGRNFHGDFSLLLTAAQKATLLQFVQGDRGITVATGVSAWADQSGAGKDYTQATAAWQPVYNATGLNGHGTVTTDGTDDFLTSSLALPAPATTPSEWYGVIRQVTWILNGRIFGGSNNIISLYSHSSTPNLRAYAGLSGAQNNGAAVGSWVRGNALFSSSSANDFLKLGSVSSTGLSFGSAAGGGTTRTLGCDGTTLFSNVSIALSMWFSAALGTAMRAQLDVAVKSYYGSSVGI